MYFGDGYYMGGMHAFWWLFWLGLIVVLWFAVGVPRRRNEPRERETPHETLRRRLARGEITPEAYEQAKALLDRDGPPAA